MRAPARGVVKAERWRRVDAEGDAGGPATRWLVKVQTRLRATKDPNAEREAAVGFGCIRRSALPFTHATWHCLAFMIFDVPVVVVEMTTFSFIWRLRNRSISKDEGLLLQIYSPKEHDYR